MKTSDFNYLLPEELIARYPLNQRTESRLLSLASSGQIGHHIFSELPDLLKSNDVLIFNNTRVIPARLFANKLTGAKVEILIERILESNFAFAHLKTNKSIKLPCKLKLTDEIYITVWERHEGLFKLEFHSDKTVRTLLTEFGSIPLPNYLNRQVEESDNERYQTVYAENEGAIAAPTAGLHFDQFLLDSLQKKGIKLGFITLHVGAGTFKPVSVENIIDHRMHAEILEISPAVCDLINKSKSQGSRIIAIGTTTVRALESAMQNKEYLSPYSGETNIFIYPGYRFRCIDALITNFHLPKSSLLMLVCALGGYEEVMNSYQVAIQSGYRFFSYGDAMFLDKSKL